MDKTEFEYGEELFRGEEQGYKFLATGLINPKGQALVSITSPDGEVVKEFLFPSYKIWNVAAHAADIIDGLKEGDPDDGIRTAGSTGFGGNVYNK